MPDVLTPEQRRLNMSRIRAKNTRPEVMLRSALHKSGLRYRLHDRKLPGCPDLVFSRFRALVFVHGCFWHSHGCYRTVAPSTRPDFWSSKLGKNRDRDARNLGKLADLGWRVCIVWECALSGKTSRELADVVRSVRTWLRTSEPFAEVSGSGIREAA